MKTNTLPLILLDENVAGLAKWLRFLGFDTEITSQEAPDELVLRKAIAEKRILITRDQDLIKSAPSDVVLAIDSDFFEDQVLKCLSRLGAPDSKHWFSLCTICNVKLKTMTDEEIQSNPLIPKFVKESHDPEVKCAWECAKCERIYWKGSHFERTRAILEQLAGKIEKKGDSQLSPLINL